jgi:capsular polysaccharide export protein
VSYVPRLLAMRRRGRRARARKARWAAERRSFFLVPLQMQSDYQLRANSPFADQRQFIAKVMASFAAHAAPGERLVFKVHPLDNGLERWPRVIGRMARAHGIAGRVNTIDGGDLQTLIRMARGTVLTNSTVGIHALRAGCPVKVLGIALFDIPGLTHQGPLDHFWTCSEQPDATLLEAFVRAVAGTIQVKGNFFTPAGRAAAIPEIARRLIAGEVNASGALETPPPRLARARAMGVPFIEPGAPSLPTPEACPEAPGLVAPMATTPSLG